jgi:mRNA interferase MazF
LTPPTTRPTSYQAGEFILVDFPFSSGRQAKIRPVLVILDTGDADVLVARITSGRPAGPFDVGLVDWQQGGLKSASTVRLHKMNTIEKSRSHHRIGLIQPADRQRVSDVLRQTFGNW